MNSVIQNRIIAGGALLLACCQGALAQASPPSESLADGLDRAMATRLEARMAATDVEAARAEVKQAKARFYPAVDLLADFNRRNSHDTFTGISASIDVPPLGMTRVDVTRSVPRYEVSPALRATYDLYAGGRDEAGLRHATLGMRSAELGAQQAQQEIALQVSTAYLKLRRACVEWTSATSASSVAAKARQLASTRYRDGRLPDIEYQAALVTAMEKEQALASKVVAVRIAHADYVHAVDDQAVTSAEPAAVCSFSSPVSNDVKLALALARRDLYADQQASGIDMAKEKVSIEKAASRVQVSLVLQHSYIGRSDESFRDSMSSIKRQETLLGLRLTYNFFDGLATDARVQEAQAGVERKRLQGERDAALADQNARRSQYRREEAEAARQLANSRQELAHARRTLATRRLETGTGSSMALEESIAAEQEARAAVAAAEIDSAMADVEQAYAAVPRPTARP